MDRDRARARPRRSSRSTGRSTLEHRYLVGERGADALHLLPTFVADADGELRPNPEAARLDARNARDPRLAAAGPARRLRTPSRVEIVERLAAEAMLPAIVFIFSRRAATRPSSSASPPGSASPSPASGPQIRADRRAPRPRRSPTTTSTCSRYDQWLAGLEAGFAAHHAGMVPPMKEAVEEAFAAGLVKVVFATETLALGINMPARSVVIEKLSKFTGEHHEFLTPGEYTQLTGRAGRRGIDERRLRGRAAGARSCPSTRSPSLASRRTDALHVVVPARRTTWPPTSCAATRSRGAPPAQPVVRAVPRRPRRRRARAPARAQPRSMLGAPARAAGQRPRRRRGVPARSRRARRAPRRNRGGDRRDRRGDRRAAPRRRRRASGAAAGGSWCSTTSTGAAAAAALRRAHARAATSCGSGPDDFDGAAPAASPPSSCPTPFAPRNPAFRRQAAERLRRVEAPRRRRRAPPRRRGVRPSSTRRSPTHPLRRDPAARRTKLRAAAAVERLERDVHAHRAPGARPQREPGPPVRPGARACSRRGATSTAGRSPTPASGSPASTPRPTCSLAEALARRAARRARAARARRGRVVLHLRAARARRPAPDAAARAGRRKTVAQAGARRSSASATDLNANEDDAGLPETRAPDPGFTPYVARLGGGRRARRRARRRRDDRRRLRAQREAVHRPAAPGRRRRARPETPRDAPVRPPTRATAAWSPRRASPAAERRRRDREGRAVGAPGRGPGRVARRGRRRRAGGRGRATIPARAIEFRPDADVRPRPCASGSRSAPPAPSGPTELALRRAARRRRRTVSCSRCNMVVRRRRTRPASAGRARARRSGSPSTSRVVHDGRATARRGRERPVPARRRRRAPRPPGRRPGRGPGVRARRAASGRRCARGSRRASTCRTPRSPRRTRPPRRDRGPTGARSPLEVDGVARAAGRRARDRRRRARRPSCSCV